MPNIFKRIAIVATSATFVLGIATPAIAAADNQVDISGNGASSINTVTVDTSCTTVIDQSNKTKVETSVNINQNSGNNQASKNTGGDVSITTGDNDAAISVMVGGSSNSADVNPCCCSKTSDTSISKNGESSINSTNLSSTNLLVETQTNYKKVKTKVKVKQNTGKNKTNKNTNSTGNTVSVETGGNTGGVGVSVTGDTNSL